MIKKEKNDAGFRGIIIWPVIFSIILIAANVYVLVFNKQAGLFMLVFIALYMIVILVFYFTGRSRIKTQAIEYAKKYFKSQLEFLEELSIPYAVLDESSKVIWADEAFIGLVKKDPLSKKITSFFPEINDKDLSSNVEELNIDVVYENRNYRAQLKKIKEKGFFEALYLFDETKVKQLIKENTEQKMMTGLIYIDNYEEALETVEDVRQSLLLALVDRKINKYFHDMDGVVKKLEKDKYFVAIMQKYLPTIQSEKFSILDEVKTINIGNQMPITISIGLGLNGPSYNANCDYSRMAIDLALGRGGDQAVIKDADRIYYYGGKSKQVEKNTRVKARIKAHAFRELLESKEKVIIMGHKIGDIDSFGSSIGVYRAVKSLDRRAYILINEITTTVRPLFERFLNQEEYETDMFINAFQAKEIIDDKTVLVLVDVNKPSFVEAPELITSSIATVVLDHHRQSSEIIENAVLSYIEPFASSTCEMVAELLQYISDGVKLKQVEADAMYAGIIIDTNYFTNKTGVRTFEAAAFLKRNGADVARVKKLFRDDIEDYKARAEAINNAEIFEDIFIIAECPSEKIESPTVVAAQTANEFLNINGIKSSFVITDYNNKIYISARSIDDEINVQLIMERLGGGGHLNTAGAQLENCTINEAKRIIKSTVKKMMEEGEI